MTREKLSTILGNEIRNLNPGYFALVMATGIVSIATYLLDMRPIAWALFWINVGSYAILWILTIIRLVRFFPQFTADLTNHMRGPGHFTIIAGTCVLGSQLVLLTSNATAAVVLWVLGILLWIVLIYTFFTAVTVAETKPSLGKGINGAWLITTVSTQSVSVLGTLVASNFSDWQQQWALFFALGMYLLGGMMYILIMALIFYRFTFFTMAPEELTPPYWINMGAVAITTLAGALLILNASQFAFLQDILPFLKGFTVFFWAAGTWWIPLLFILGAWLHLYKRFTLRYSPQYWGMVFPLGMYTTSTFQLARAIELPFLLVIPGFFVYIAIIAWLLTFIGLIYTIGKVIRLAFV
ncbi:MAG: tellurite resistance/C4-dicarboxylate transporter family protein [Chloroflexi bacterium]|nr:tellurite resistance/C4-dicarboxylate transporter family protein [Chloroflexota bacterium]MBI3930712.1 tellurite resistance/C4-dicarboxylate transporter family protein [Chloroflexota bacterium]